MSGKHRLVSGRTGSVRHKQLKGLRDASQKVKSKPAHQEGAQAKTSAHAGMAEAYRPTWEVKHEDEMFNTVADAFRNG